MSGLFDNNVHFTILHLMYHGRGTAVQSTVPMAPMHLGKKKKREIRESSDTVVAHDKGVQQLV